VDDLARAARLTAANTPGGFFETPASQACVYKLVNGSKTCNPTTAATVAKGGAGKSWGGK
jgi:hypothetical protein